MSQINFFLTQDEIASKMQAILAMDSFIVFSGNAFNTPAPETISDVNQLIGFRSLILWVKNNCRTPYATIDGANALTGKFLFDYLKDPIIEIQNCSYKDGLFSPGRVYFKAGWIEDKELRVLHQKAGNKLLRLFDKDTTKLKKLWRVSPTVKELVMRGGELELGSNGFRISKANIDAA